MSGGYYYLHSENNALIYKRELGDTAADLRESNFVRMFWPLDTNNRETAWRILIEAQLLGANAARIAELTTHWNCDNEDAQHFANRVGVKLTRDGDQWCATRKDFIDLQQSPAGFGDTCLDAFVELARQLNLQPMKMWGRSFSDVVQSK